MSQMLSHSKNFDFFLFLLKENLFFEMILQNVGIFKFKQTEPLFEKITFNYPHKLGDVSKK